jgi:hypothetical protein
VRHARFEKRGVINGIAMGRVSLRRLFSFLACERSSTILIKRTAT